MYLLVMLDTLLLRLSLHFTTLHPTTLHSTLLHLTTLHVLPFKLHPALYVTEQSDAHLTRQALFTYKRNFSARLRNHWCRVKAISIIYSKCTSVALINQHEMRMRHTILSSVACLAVPYFSHYLIN